MTARMANRGRRLEKILRRELLTLGSISAFIDQGQYTILLTAVIGSAVVPTLIAQLWFRPHFAPLEEDA